MPFGTPLEYVSLAHGKQIDGAKGIIDITSGCVVAAGNRHSSRLFSSKIRYPSRVDVSGRNRPLMGFVLFNCSFAVDICEQERHGRSENPLKDNL